MREADRGERGGGEKIRGGGEGAGEGASVVRLGRTICWLSICSVVILGGDSAGASSASASKTSSASSSSSCARAPDNMAKTNTKMKMKRGIVCVLVPHTAHNAHVDTVTAQQSVGASQRPYAKEKTNRIANRIARNTNALRGASRAEQAISGVFLACWGPSVCRRLVGLC